MAGGSEGKRLIRVPIRCNDSPKEESSILEDESRKLSKKDEWCVIRLISFLPGVTAESFGNFSCENLFTNVHYAYLKRLAQPANKLTNVE